MLATQSFGQHLSVESGMVFSDLYYFDKAAAGSSSFQEPAYKPKIGFNIGVVYKFHEKLPFQVGVAYALLGARHNLVEDGFSQAAGPSLFPVEEDVILSLHYLNIKAHYLLKVATGLRFLVGPQIGYLLSSKRVGEGGEEGFLPNVFEVDNRFDFGINLSLLLTLNEKFSAVLNGYNGFGVVEEALVLRPSKTRNRYASIGVSYRIY